MRRLRRVLLALTAFALVFPPAGMAAPTSRANSVTFTDADNGYASGTYSSATNDPVGFISRTSDGGQTWSAFSSLNRNFLGVDSIGGMNAWAVSWFSLNPWKTTDSGAAWGTAAGALVPAVEIPAPEDVAQVDASTSVVVGTLTNEDVYGTQAAIWRTTDAGGAWTLAWSGPEYPYNTTIEAYPDVDAQLSSVDAAGNAVFAGGLETAEGPGTQTRGLMTMSTDGGQTWSALQLMPPAMPNVESVSAVSSTAAWAAGGTRVARFNGTSWATTAANPGFNVNAVDAIDANTAVVVGDSGRVAYTTNGGASWTGWAMPLPLRNLHSVSFRGTGSAVAVGDDQAVVRLTLGATVTGSVLHLVDGAWSGVKPATSLSLTVPSTSNYQSAALKGTLTKSGGGYLPAGTPVAIQYSYTPTTASSWKTLTTVTTGGTGAFAYTAKPTRTTYYRARFYGNTTFSSATSAYGKVVPKVYLSNPVAPSTMYTTKYSTIYGYLKPRHTAGSYPVRIYRYRWTGSSWVQYGSYVKAKATNYSSYSKFSASVKLPYKGRWRVRAYHPGDSLNASTWSSGYDYITVK